MEQFDNWADAEQYFLPEFEDTVEDEVDEHSKATDGDVVPTPKTEVEAKTLRISRGPDQDGPGLPGLPSDLSQMLLSKLNFKEPGPAGNSQNDIKSSNSLPSFGTQSDEGSRASSRSSRTSPEYADRNGAKPERGHNRSTSTSSNIPTTPTALRPLLSALLWRLHHEQGSTILPQNLTLVSNDHDTQVWAQKFGIMTKNIHQLRTAIQYEEKEFKNRVKYAEKTHHVTPSPKPLFSYENDSEEDELVFVPRGRGKGASRGNGSRSANGRKPRAAAAAAAAIAQADTTVEVPSQPIDPDSFSRSIGATMTVRQPALDPTPHTGASRDPVASSRRHGGDHSNGNDNANGNGGGGSSRRRRQRGAGSSRATPLRGGRGQGKLWVP